MRKHNAGFSLVEVLVAIVLLGAMVVPICTSLVTSIRVNEKTDAMLQAQLDVSSAVEHLMATGVTETFATAHLGTVTDAPQWMDVPSEWSAYSLGPEETDYIEAYSKVYFDIDEHESHAYYSVVITDKAGLVEVETSIRKEGA